MDINKSKKKVKAIGAGTPSEFDYLTVVLRQMHDSVADEPVPDDFLDLLDRIDAKMSSTQKFQ